MSVEAKIRVLSLLGGTGLLALTTAGCAVSPPGFDSRVKPTVEPSSLPSYSPETAVGAVSFSTADCNQMDVKVPIPAGWYFRQDVDPDGFRRCTISEQPLALGGSFDTGVTILQIPIPFGVDPKSFTREIMSRRLSQRLPVGETQEKVVPPFTVLERDFLSTEGNKLRGLRGKVVASGKYVYTIFFETLKTIEQKMRLQFGQPILDGVIVEGIPTR